MDVQLYVYDLTRGMARAMSQQLVGIHIDAVYHTSLVFDGIEYFFGAGVQSRYPGSTHHGQPMEVIPMGTTHLPIETILEYLDSLKQVYTPESYDLFEHNCNNFTNDFGMFLVGKGIPDHITNLPRRVLETPFGQMLKPQFDASMRSITQAPVPPQRIASSNSMNGNVRAQDNSFAPSSLPTNSTTAGSSSPYGSVINLTSLNTLEDRLRSAVSTVSTIFFTSSTCAPCKLAYPMFDRLAEQYSHALFVKIDINEARDVAARYQIRATPTFMTFSRGTKQEEWASADPNMLKANVERVIQQTFPPHPHKLLKVATLQFGSLKPVTYAKVPPLEKLMAKLGPMAEHEELSALRRFIEKRNADPKDAKLPNLDAIGKTFRTNVLSLPIDIRFAAFDLLRCAMVDARVSGYFAEERTPQTVQALIEHVNGLDACPHNLRLVTIHLGCNLFTSPLYAKELMRSGNALLPVLVQLVTSSLLDASHPTTRVASASLAFDLAVSNYRIRREEEREAMEEGAQVEMAASLVETLSTEENPDAVKALLLALGYLAYCAPESGELLDLCKALDVSSVVSACKGHDGLAKEVKSLF